MRLKSNSITYLMSTTKSTCHLCIESKNIMKYVYVHRSFTFVGDGAQSTKCTHSNRNRRNSSNLNEREIAWIILINNLIFIVIMSYAHRMEYKHSYSSFHSMAMYCSASYLYCCVYILIHKSIFRGSSLKFRKKIYAYACQFRAPLSLTHISLVFSLEWKK